MLVEESNKKPQIARQVTLDKLIAVTKQDMESVNEIIFNLAQSQSDLIPIISKYIASAGGKRIRPMLTLISANMFGYKTHRDSSGNIVNNHIKLASAVEFMHTATLLHDDVVDESNMRRGREAARKIWGNQASVLVGDFLLGQAFSLMVEAGSMAALKVLSKAACVIAEGEVMQLVASKSFETSIEDYFSIINAKTAELFAASMAVGAIISERSEGEISAVTSFGQNLGVAFQLVDDILDYSGEAGNLGKNIGDDFREGKITLPAILCYENCDAAGRQFWVDALTNGKNGDSELQKAIELLNQHNSLEQATQQAKIYGDRAKADLLSLGSAVDTDMKNILNDVVDFCLWRLG